MATKKQCSRCRKDKPADRKHFYRSKSAKDGLQSMCIECQRDRDTSKKRGRR
jgi:hypothetical protein